MPANPPASDPRIQQAVPFIKWAGGKTQLLEQLIPLLPSAPVRHYYEPFVGSAAVFYALRKRAFAGQYHLSDVNPELVNVYAVVRDSVDALIARLAEHRDAHAEDDRGHYYAVRDRDRGPDGLAALSSLERAARMIYLNKTCYNGLWRVNRKGQFNVPIGRYVNPPILDEIKLRAASAALQGVDVAERSYQAALDQATNGDFVYFDPPYVPLSNTANFTSYAKDDFGEPDQRLLADLFRALDRRGVRVMLSNADAPLVRELYAGFRFETVQARRAINSRARRRGPIDELVVLNY